MYWCHLLASHWGITLYQFLKPILSNDQWWETGSIGAEIRVLQPQRTPALPYHLVSKERQLPACVVLLWHAETPAAHWTQTPQPLHQLASPCPASSLTVPFNLPALVYIVSGTIGVLLAAIMKGTVLICCFLSLLLLQATAGKRFDQCVDRKCGDSDTIRVVHPGNGICLPPNHAVEWNSSIGWGNHSFLLGFSFWRCYNV